MEADNVPKNNKPQGRPPNPEGPNKPIGMRPKPHVRKALDKYIADQDVEVKHAAVLAAALEEFLEKRGYLPADAEGEE
jgi:hypothetical protein